MSALTETRRELAALLERIGGDVKVAIGPGDHAEQSLVVRIIVGPSESEQSEETLDRMLAREGEGSVKATVEAVHHFYVSKHSGYRHYGAPEKSLLGAEWTVVTPS